MRYIYLSLVFSFTFTNLICQVQISDISVGKFSIPKIESESLNFDKINNQLKIKLLDFGYQIDVYNQSTKELLNYYQASWDENNNGYSGLSYEVVFNNDKVLSLKSKLSHLGAYPDDSFSYYNFNLNNQSLITISDLYKPYGFGPIKIRIHDAIKSRITKVKNEITGPDKEPILNWIDESFNPAAETFDYQYIITEFGITYIVDYGFPRVIQRYEPDHEIFIPYDELSDYLSKDGPLKDYAK